jgi:hypothetical protein
MVAPPQRPHVSMPDLLMPLAMPANCGNYFMAAAGDRKMRRPASSSTHLVHFGEYSKKRRAGLIEWRMEIKGVDCVELLAERPVPDFQLRENRIVVSNHNQGIRHQSVDLFASDQGKVENVPTGELAIPS